MDDPGRRRRRRRQALDALDAQLRAAVEAALAEVPTAAPRSSEGDRQRLRGLPQRPGRRRHPGDAPRVNVRLGR